MRYYDSLTNIASEHHVGNPPVLNVTMSKLGLWDEGLAAYWISAIDQLALFAVRGSVLDVVSVVDCSVVDVAAANYL